jgi:hypothetical protein
MNVRSWDEVNRRDVRPGRGVVKVWLMNGYDKPQQPKTRSFRS